MTQRIAALLIVFACLALGGCAAPAMQQGAGPASPAAVMDAITLGTSSKADVQSRFGPAHAMVKFDSGYEVWAYQFAPATSVMANIGALFQRLGDGTAPPGMNEVVILFAPSGVATKMRLRQMPPAVKS